LQSTYFTARLKSLAESYDRILYTLEATSVRIIILLDVKQCSLVQITRRFGETVGYSWSSVSTFLLTFLGSTPDYTPSHTRRLSSSYALRFLPGISCRLIIVPIIGGFDARWQPFVKYFLSTFRVHRLKQNITTGYS
jgi:hypothetical protein